MTTSTPRPRSAVELGRRRRRVGDQRRDPRRPGTTTPSVVRADLRAVGDDDDRARLRAIASALDLGLVVVSSVIPERAETPAAPMTATSKR